MNRASPKAKKRIRQRVPGAGNPGSGSPGNVTYRDLDSKFGAETRSLILQLRKLW